MRFLSSPLSPSIQLPITTMKRNKEERWKGPTILTKVSFQSSQCSCSRNFQRCRCKTTFISHFRHAPTTLEERNWSMYETVRKQNFADAWVRNDGWVQRQARWIRS